MGSCPQGSFPMDSGQNISFLNVLISLTLVRSFCWTFCPFWLEIWICALRNNHTTACMLCCLEISFTEQFSPLFLSSKLTQIFRTWEQCSQIPCQIITVISSTLVPNEFLFLLTTSWVGPPCPHFSQKGSLSFAFGPVGLTYPIASRAPPYTHTNQFKQLTIHKIRFITELPPPPAAATFSTS